MNVTHPQSKPRYLVLGILLASVGVISSLAIFQMLKLREERVVRAEFHRRAHEQALAIQREFSTAQVMIDSMAAYYYAAEEMNGEGFGLFADALLQRYRGVHGLGFNRWITLEERASYESAMRAEGYKDFEITERTVTGKMAPALDRTAYVSVTYIRPLASNEKAHGFDIYSEEKRRKAIDLARSTRAMAATGPIKLVQETGHQMGALLIQPVYADPEAADPEGFMIGVFRVGDLVETALKRFSQRDVYFQLEDTTESEPIMLFETESRVSMGPMRDLEKVSTFPLGGRVWALHAHPQDAFVASYRTAAPWIALLSGLLFTGLIVAYVLHLKRLNQRLRDSEAKFLQLANNLQEVFWMFDLKARKVLYISPAFEKVYAQQIDDVYHDTEVFFDAVHPEDRELVEETVTKLGEGEPTQARYRICRPDGSVRWVRDRGFPVVGPDGPTGRAVGLAEDITVRKQLEDERDQLQAKVQQAQKLEGFGVLAGGIAHDYNNLLTSILGHAALALDDAPEDAPVRQDLLQIQHAGQLAAKLTAQMLAYSGRGHFIKQQLDLSEVVLGTQSLLASSVGNGTRLVYELEKNLPAIKGDPNQIRQVLLNLAINGSEAMEEEAGTLTITTGKMEADRAYLSRSYYDTELSPGTYVFLEVKDQGCGMDDKIKARIFDPFFSTRFVGRGLGLPAVIGIIRGHEGAIFIESEEGVGSSFRVLFPLAS